MMPLNLHEYEVAARAVLPPMVFDEATTAGVACASTGNHGQGMALAAALFGRRAVVDVVALAVGLQLRDAAIHHGEHAPQVSVNVDDGHGRARWRHNLQQLPQRSHGLATCLPAERCA
jgi:threonine dehydratase